MSGEKCMRLYAAAGVPIEKMVLGSSFGSRMWRNTKGLSQPGETRRGGPPAPGAPRGPRFGFADIYYRHLQEGSEFKRYWDDQAKAAYLYNGTDFICYEDEESIAHKCKFVVEHNMAGIMYWQYGSDPTGRLLDAMTNPDNWKGAR